MRTAISAILAAAISVSAHAQEQILGFPENQFGSAGLFYEQSGAALDAQRAVAGDLDRYEPMYTLYSTRPFDQVAIAVGRLDVLMKTAEGRRSVFPCTASAIAVNLILTAHHCIRSSHGLTPVQAKFLAGYDHPDDDAHFYDVSLEPIEESEALDYVILEFAEGIMLPPVYDFSEQKIEYDERGVPLDRPQQVFLYPLSFTTAPVESSEPLYLLHHPMGGAKRVTRQSCNAYDPARKGILLRHRCDTQPGSSGALLFNRVDSIYETYSVAGMHIAGGLNEDPESFNRAVSFDEIANDSKIVFALRTLANNFNSYSELEATLAIMEAQPALTSGDYDYELIRGFLPPKLSSSSLDPLFEMNFRQALGVSPVALPGRPDAVPVFFQWDRFALDPTAEQVLYEVVAQVRNLEASTGARMMYVTTSTMDTDSPIWGYNILLARLQASSIRKFLLKNGVDESAIVIRAFGTDTSSPTREPLARKTVVEVYRKPEVVNALAR